MWNIKITPINIGTKEVRINATRTDIDESVFTTTTTATIDTTANKTAALDAIWSDWQRYKAKQTNIASIIGDLEVSGAANLDARE